MTNQHPITPPPELVWEWTSLANEEDGDEVWIFITTQAARWGADQELDACCEWVSMQLHCTDQEHLVPHLRAARRPKPPSLKEQALNCLADIEHGATPCPSDFDSIRRALEALPE